MIYKTYKTDDALIQDNAAYYTDEQGRMISFLFNLNNTDYQAYLKWLAEGNTPQEAE